MTARRILLLSLPLAACVPGRPGYLPEVPDDVVSRFERFVRELELSRLDRDEDLRRRAGLPPSGHFSDSIDRSSAVDAALVRRERSRLESFSPAGLDAGARLTRRVLDYEAGRRLERLEWHGQAYLAVPGDDPVTRLHGALIEASAGTDAAGAEEWIRRAREAGPWLDARTERLEERHDRGLIAPRAALTAVAERSRALTPAGDDAGESPWLAAFRSLLDDLPELDPRTREELSLRATAVLEDVLHPALARWTGVVEALAARSPGDAGVWSLPEGEAWYAHLTRDVTGLTLSPAALHELGRQEVARLEGELAVFTAQLDAPGRPEPFVRLLQQHPELTAPPGEEGRRILAQRARSAATLLESTLPDLLEDPPELPFEVEEHIDPDPRTLRPYRVLALLARRWAPGEHLRERVVAGREDLPALRRHLRVPAWSEGWDLYATALPVEIGAVEDPYEAIGVVTEELWAAALLVVDTGLHDRRWTVDRCRSYLSTTTAVGEERVRAAVDHLLTHPGSAAAAPVGCLRLREMRRESERRLGEDFELARFHRYLLRAGPLPLSILEEHVRRWEPRS